MPNYPYPILYVPQRQFDELDKIQSVATIAFNKKLKGIVRLQGQDYAIVGAAGTGTGIGWESFLAVDVVPDFLYKGSLIPMDYDECGEDRRGYKAMKIKYEGRDYVLVGNLITIKPNNNYQLSLF
jgi:hypothetical protein